MKSQRQGTICLSIGLLLLGTYLFCEQEPVKEQLQSQLTQFSNSLSSVSESQDSQHSSSIMGTIPGSSGKASSDQTKGIATSWLHTYRGRLVQRSLDGELTYRWQVDLRLLPPNAEGVQTVLVTESRWPDTGWSWFVDDPPSKQTTVLLRRDSKGQVQPTLRTGRYAFQKIPLDQLLSGPTTVRQIESEQDDVAAWNPTEFPWVGGNKVPYRFKCDPSSAVDSKVSVRCEDTTNLTAIDGLKRRTQITVDKCREVVTEFHSEYVQRTRLQSKRVNGALTLEESRNLSQNEVAILTRDSNLWLQHLLNFDDVVQQCAEGYHQNAFGLHDTLIELQEATTEALSQISDPMMREGFQEAVAASATGCSRMRAAAENLARLGSKRWDFGTVDFEKLIGGQRSSDPRGRVRVLAFVSSASPSACDTVIAIRRIHDSLRDKSVDVIVLSADYFEEDSHALQAACGDRLRLVRDSTLARQLGLFHLGLPWIAIVDANNQVAHLHPWLPLHHDSTVVEQTERLLAAPKDGYAGSARSVGSEFVSWTF